MWRFAVPGPGNPIASHGFPERELVARGPQAGFLLSLPVNCHQTSELLHDVLQRQQKAL